MEMKKCRKCKNEKPATDEYFYRKKGYLTSPCKDCQQKKQKKNRKKNPRPTASRPAAQAAYRSRNKTRLGKVVSRARSDNRLLALWHYGGQPPECACCGDAHIQFLCVCPKGVITQQIINSHRLYNALKKRGFPAGYEVTCQNCARSRAMFGYCPHKDEP